VRNATRGTSDYTQKLRTLADLVAQVSNELLRHQGARTQAQALASPPAGVSLAAWHGLFDMRSRALVTLRAESSGAPRGTSAPTTPAPTGTPAAAPAATPAATATAAAARQQPARQQPARQQPAQREHDVEFDIPSPEEAVTTIREVGGRALDTARGTFEAIRDVGAIITGTPSDLLGGGITTPLRMLDRLQAIMTIMNPPSVAIYQRPWFWPTLLGIGGYLGYSVYKSQQKKAPAPTAAARKPAAPALPATGAAMGPR